MSPERDPEESALDDEPQIDTEGKAVDLVLGEEDLLYMAESPHSTPEGSDDSETGDPLYDESLLRDLFYTTPVSSDNIKPCSWHSVTCSSALTSNSGNQGFCNSGLRDLPILKFNTRTWDFVNSRNGKSSKK